jgi:leader peptidase (prepilin peptidase)/N-methyltransferase
MLILDVLIVCLFVLVTGACIGSFLNVVALRAISHESIVFPSSKCPVCGEHIKWYDNIPVLSYLFTFKGKCRNCGCKVSLQYPIVEALTAIIFLAVFIAFGFTIKTLLLLILLSLAIVISITDIKEECVYDVHSWAFIIMSIVTSLYFNGIENYTKPAIGLIVAVFVMEVIARLSYYLIKKDNVEDNSENEVSAENTDNNENTTKQEETTDITEYVNTKKRAFGEGDTYLAAGTGALLGWKYLLVAIGLAIILHALFILPQFLINLYKQKEVKLLASISIFSILAVIYWVISNVFNLPVYVVFAFLIALIFFAITSITGLKHVNKEKGFTSMPFGPSILFATFLVLFWGHNVIMFLQKYIFMTVQ